MSSKSVGPVTARYAEALFNLAKREGVLDQVERDVERIAAEFATPGVGSFFLDARVSVEARRQKMGSLLQGMHPLTQNFVGLLFDKRREEVLQTLGEAFRSRALAERNTVEGVVQTARPLGASEVSGLAGSLGTSLGKTVVLENEIRPELIGGARVIVQSRMLDRSVAGRLEGLRKRMENAPLPIPQA